MAIIIFDSLNNYWLTKTITIQLFYAALENADIDFLDVDVAIVRLLDLTFFGFWVYSNWVPLRHASKNFLSRISGEGMWIINTNIVYGSF